MAVDPYKVLSENYAKRTEAINAQTQQAEAERLQREKAAQDTLTAANRGVYTSYKQQINPYGSFASQNNFSSGVSDYYKNASYGTMLQGIGTNQYNYNDAMNNSNSLWQNYLAQKAGDEADALSDYNAAVLAQQKYDKEQEDAEKERQRAIEEFNLQLKLQQEQLARQKAQDAEDKRRYDQEWAYRLQQDKLAAQRSSSGGGGGYYYSGGGSNQYELVDDDSENTRYPSGYNYQPTTNNKKSSSTKNQTVARTGYEPSGIAGKRYSVQYNSKGQVIKRKLVNSPKK